MSLGMQYVFTGMDSKELLDELIFWVQEYSNTFEDLKTNECESSKDWLNFTLKNIIVICRVLLTKGGENENAENA